MKKSKVDKAADAAKAEQEPTAPSNVTQVNFGGNSAALLDKPSELTTTEVQLLERLEKELESKLCSFWEIGKALKAIHDQGLFRGTHGQDFALYCRERWGMCYQYARRQINAAECMDALAEAFSPNGDKLPANESQVRPLVENELTSDECKKAWKKVLKQASGGKITAEMVTDVVGEMLGKPNLAKDSKPGTGSKHPSKSKLDKIAAIVTKVLKQKAELSADDLKKALVKIQKLLAAE